MADSRGQKLHSSSKGCNFVISSPVLETRYQNISRFRNAAGETIFHAIDTKTKSEVSVRHAVFDSTGLQQTLRDIRLLRQLEHENVIVFHGVVPYDGTDRTDHFYVIQELLDTNLQSVIQSGQVTVSHCKLFTYQMMRALKYIHSADIYHGNLRPDAIQINHVNLMLKIGDFVLGRRVKSVGGVNNLWYSSPEQIISGRECTTATDLWSVGCIVAEMATGQPFFRGCGKMEQLLKYIDCVHLNDDDWRKVLHVMPNKMLKNHPFRPRRALRLQLAGLDDNMVQLVDRLLTFNHQQRISAEEALGQPYLNEYYCPEDEPVARLPVRLGEEEADPTDDTNLNLLVAAVKSSSQCDVIKPQVQEQVQEQPPPPPPPVVTPIQQLDDLLCQMAVTGEVYKHGTFRQLELDRNEVALKNLRNNQDRIGDDRTPSPNIIDLLNQSFESDPGSAIISAVKGPNGKIHEADSESEKEAAEISEEKLQEDLEVGNITREELQQLGEVPVLTSMDAITLFEAFPVNSVWERNSVSIAASSCATLVTRRECQRLVKADLMSEMPNAADTVAKYFENVQEFDKHGFNKGKEENNLCSSPKSSLHPPFVLVNIPEDSNKYNSDEFNKKQKLKSQSESVQLSRKLILDKIESEKKSHRKMSRINDDLTSEEFDELYRLPTEHLRKDKSQSETVRHRHSQEWPQCGRHPDDANDRYGFYKDDRLHVEGACGGHDYYDDMQASFSRPSIEFDLEPYLPELVVERNQSLSVEDPELSAELRFIRTSGQGIAGNRDTSSSPESPASPRTIQTGARPKKSPKKHRAV